jgi:Uma2 family endonuclease
MTQITAKPNAPQPGPFRWTRALYDQAVIMGLFEGLHIELIDGEIVQMSPIHRPHVSGVIKLQRLLQRAFSTGFYVQTQSPLAIGDSEPQPDVAVVAGKEDDYRNHPTTAALVVEVADSSIATDTADKVSLYASANIPEYWVLDINNRQLIVFRAPKLATNDPRARLGYLYTQIQTLAADQSISPLGAPTTSLKIAEMLP